MECKHCGADMAKFIRSADGICGNCGKSQGDPLTSFVCLWDNPQGVTVRVGESDNMTLDDLQTTCLDAMKYIKSSNLVTTTGFQTLAIFYMWDFTYESNDDLRVFFEGFKSL